MTGITFCVNIAPRIWTIPSDKMAKSWKFMILEIITKTRSVRKCRISLDETFKTIYRTNLFRTDLKRYCLGYLGPIFQFKKISDDPTFLVSPKRGYLDFGAGGLLGIGGGIG